MDFSKLNIVMKPMNLDFWKDLQEEASFGGLGAAPCPAMGQVSSTACTVNGIPVEGKSVKKKKNKKKNEDIEVKHEGILEVPEDKNVDDLPIKHFQSLIDKKGYGKIIKALTNLEVWNKKKNPELSSWAENMIDKLQKKNKNESVRWLDSDGVEHVELDERPSTTLDDIDREETIRNMEAKGLLDTPKTVFARNKGEIDDPEFEDAINILLFGTKDDVDEYKELCATFAECGRYDDFLRFAQEKYGLYGTMLDSYNVGADIDENFEIKWLDEEFIDEEGRKITVYFSNYVENGQFVSKPLDIVIGQYYAKPGSKYVRKVTGYDPEYNNVWVLELNPSYRNILRDKSQDHRDFEHLASQEQIDEFNKTLEKQREREQNIQHYAVMDKATGNVWTYKTREERDNKYKEVRDSYSGSDYIDVRKAYLDDDGNFVKWESVDEDFHEAYERITNLLAKQLDRMNFEFANTDEIIYKKEGEYKYLLKFDNEIGILKFKVTKGDDVIIEKEWQLDEKEDVSPIFSEIEDIYNKYGI